MREERKRTNTSVTSAGDVNTSRNRSILVYLSPSRATRGSETVSEKKRKEKEKEKNTSRTRCGFPKGTQLVRRGI